MLTTLAFSVYHPILRGVNKLQVIAFETYIDYIEYSKSIGYLYILQFGGVCPNALNIGSTRILPLDRSIY